MNRHAAAPYPFRDKIRPFMRGILGWAPLVEVALVGLERDIPAAQRAIYIDRIVERGSTGHVYRAFLGGLGESEQDMLGEAFERRYEAAKMQYERDRKFVAARAECQGGIDESRSALSAPMLLELKRTYVRESVTHAFMLLRDGHVTSEQAQLGFASIIYADGLKEHADELVKTGAIGNSARQVLRFRRAENGNVA